MKKKAFLAFLVLAVALPFACKKNESDTSGNITVQGNVTLTLSFLHHTWGMPSIPVYLKFNATQWPGKDSTKYDVVQPANREGVVTFTKLGPGNFVVYASGYDSIFRAHVIGYKQVIIGKENANTTVTDTVYVSE